MAAALETAATTLGPIEVLQYSLFNTSCRACGASVAEPFSSSTVAAPCDRPEESQEPRSSSPTRAPTPRCCTTNSRSIASTLLSSSFPARSSEVIRGRTRPCSPRRYGACTPSVMAFGISPIPSTADQSRQLLIINPEVRRRRKPRTLSGSAGGRSSQAMCVHTCRIAPPLTRGPARTAANETTNETTNDHRLPGGSTQGQREPRSL